MRLLSLSVSVFLGDEVPWVVDNRGVFPFTRGADAGGIATGGAE